MTCPNKTFFFFFLVLGLCLIFSIPFLILQEEWFMVVWVSVMIVFNFWQAIDSYIKWGYEAQDDKVRNNNGSPTLEERIEKLNQELKEHRKRIEDERDMS